METMNSAEPITTSTQDPKPGQPVGTEGRFVTVEGAEPLPLNADGTVDWSTAGFEVVRRDSEGNPEQVQIKDKTHAVYVWLRVAKIAEAMKYLGEPRMLAALNGNGAKVKQQATARSYAEALKEGRVDAWDKESKLLRPTYETIMLQKLWASLAGIQLEKRQGGVRTVEVRVLVVTLPNGAKFEVDKTDTETEPVMQLFSAYVDALTQEPLEMDIDDAMDRGQKMLEKGKLHEMLGLEKA